MLQVRNHCRLIAYSSIYVTAPIGYTNQADFLNMVVEVDSSSYTPERLLALLKKIEDRIGRKETFRWGPRIIDIDILYIEGIHRATEELTGRQGYSQHTHSQTDRYLVHSSMCGQEKMI